jgi:2-dehydropantoate 2-reductase
MRYVIIGAGAIGGTIAARLAQHSSDHPPLLVARGANADAIEGDGLRIRSPEDDAMVRVDVARTPADAHLRTDDVLVLATKTHQAQAALGEWVDAPVADADDPDGAGVGTAGELLPLLCATNGIATERFALRLFDRVFGVCVWLPAVHLEPGEVIVRIAPSSGTFIVGRYPVPGSGLDRADADLGSDDADEALLRVLADDWGAATFTVHPVEDVMRWKHRKLMSNLGNALQALVGPGSDLGPVAERLVVEAEDVLEASGLAWASEAEEDAWRGDAFDVRPVPGTPETLGGSSWQSVERGSGSIESDYLNGEIAYLARLAGTSAPLNATVQRLARQAATAGRAPGSMTVADLERELPQPSPSWQANT